MAMRKCPRCGMNADHPVNELDGTKGKHWAEARCRKCDSWIQFVSKPEDLRAANRKRQSKHKKLVKKYGDGYCQMCLVLESHLPPGDTLEGHHVIEHRDGGEASEANTWILCSSCHSTVTHERTYRGHWAGTEGVYHESEAGQDTSDVGGTAAVGTLEDSNAGRPANESTIPLQWD